MSTSREEADAIVALLEQVADIRIRGMMGGWLVYSDDVLIGQINERELFLKSTPATAELTATLEQRPPYSGAKPALVIDPAHLNDTEWLRNALSVTTDALRPTR
jgi:TfoX/Sxy family transcriptional regulator of competence genes